jgi:hypothetical protein
MHFLTKKLIASTLLATATLSSAARVTYYNPEDPAQTHGSGAAIGSCGTKLSSNVHSAAIAGLPWGSSQCGSTVAVTNNANGQCMEMPVLDNCAGCAPDAIDLTESAFRALFGSGGVGDGSWRYGSCGNVAPPQSQAPAPQAPPPRTQALPPPVTTEVPPAPEPTPAPVVEVKAEPFPAPTPVVPPVVKPEEIEQPVPAIPEAVVEQPSTTQVPEKTQAPEITQALETTQAPITTQVAQTTDPLTQTTQSTQTSAASNSAVSKPTSIPENVVAAPVTEPESTQAGLSVGAIVGIVVGSVAAVASIAGSLVYVQRRKQASAVHTIAGQSPVTVVEASA